MEFIIFELIKVLSSIHRILMYKVTYWTMFIDLSIIYLFFNYFGFNYMLSRLFIFIWILIILFIMKYLFKFFNLYFYLRVNNDNKKNRIYLLMYNNLNIYLLWLNIKLFLISSLRLWKRVTYKYKLILSKTIKLIVLLLDVFFFLIVKIIKVVFNYIIEKNIWVILKTRWRYFLVISYINYYIELKNIVYIIIILLVISFFIKYIFECIEKYFVKKYIKRNFNMDVILKPLVDNFDMENTALTISKQKAFNRYIKLDYKEIYENDLYRPRFIANEKYGIYFYNRDHLFYLVGISESDYKTREPLMFNYNIEDFYWYNRNYYYQDMMGGLKLGYIMYYNYYLYILIDQLVKIGEFFKQIKKGNMVEIKKSIENEEDRSTIWQFFSFYYQYLVAPISKCTDFTEFNIDFSDKKKLLFILDNLKNDMGLFKEFYRDYRGLLYKFKKFWKLINNSSINNGQHFELILKVYSNSWDYSNSRMGLYINVNNSNLKNWTNIEGNKKMI